MERFGVHRTARERAHAEGQHFLVAFYRREIARKPSNLAALAELGQVLTELRRYEEGLGVDRQLARLAPDNPVVQYNLACSLALTGRTEEAFDTLEAAIAAGYDDWEHLEADSDLSLLRGDERFERIVHKLRCGREA